MPITSSAKKALRGSARKHDFNLKKKELLDKTVKKFKKLVAEKKADEAKSLMPQVQKAIDKAVKTGLIKANAGSRKKSRLSALVKTQNK
jgi:ribosomal protein S20